MWRRKAIGLRSRVVEEGYRRRVGETGIYDLEVTDDAFNAGNLAYEADQQIAVQFVAGHAVERDRPVLDIKMNPVQVRHLEIPLERPVQTPGHGPIAGGLPIFTFAAADEPACHALERCYHSIRAGFRRTPRVGVL